ncbi:MerR family transcriptional regulator [Cryptosporangium aurantiacum]|uniref:DNA polymerase III beta subunit, C-terminal domain n=1 Tax=Cryptosporangium aurantiacum TaxID=134849 RepID=A0A1M7QTX9_9ACTN|nr:MerR family transcriptional regulator [Cryptosporangium aurantiacum]SHN35066.1 DNA polymerase III beta subunit, C-terminal domain [Cryptosporangium aurantiacum]
MPEIEPLLSIGSFARRVGLAPSALRFYDDCGVLHPIEVDPATGYRYYAPEQTSRAVRIRQLREAGLPLIDTLVVLDGSEDEARAVLAAYARRARTAADQADQLLRGAGAGAGAAPRASVGGPELASAIRQVTPSADTTSIHPVLRGVLLEIDGTEVRLVATDQYRLAVRVLHPRTPSEGAVRAVLEHAGLVELAGWAVRQPEVVLEIGASGVRAQDRDLPVLDAEYPAYRIVLDALPPVRHRVIAGRQVICAAIAAAADAAHVVLCTDEQHLAVADRLVPAVCTGPPLQLAFDPRVLLPALEAGVGPDVLLEVASPVEPVVVRSADQGTFTTLVMPVRV